MRPEKSRLSLLAFILKRKWSHIAYTQCVHCQNVRNSRAPASWLWICVRATLAQNLLFLPFVVVFGRQLSTWADFRINVSSSARGTTSPYPHFVGGAVAEWIGKVNSFLSNTRCSLNRHENCILCGPNFMSFGGGLQTKLSCLLLLKPRNCFAKSSTCRMNRAINWEGHAKLPEI